MSKKTRDNIIVGGIIAYLYGVGGTLTYIVHGFAGVQPAHNLTWQQDVVSFFICGGAILVTILFAGICACIYGGYLSVIEKLQPTKIKEEPIVLYW